MMEYNEKDVSNWDEQDFENFVHDNGMLFRIFVKRYIKDASFGEDIVQDTLFKLWTHRSNLNNVVDATSYVLTMIKHNALNTLRKYSKLDYTNAYDINSYDETDFFNDILRAETYSILLRAVESLPEINRKIMMMSLNGLKNDQIAQELSLTIDSVKSLKWRSINMFKKILPGELVLIYMCILLGV